MSHDTLIHRGVRALIGPLSKAGITPNQITTARLITGLGAAGAYAMGEAVFVYWGSALLVISIALDRVDGELARATDQMSEWGHKFDLISDAVVNGVVFLGIGIGLRASSLGLWSVALGLLAAAAVMATLVLVVLVESRHGTKAAAVPLTRYVDPDDAMLIAPLVMVFGGAPGLLIAAATIAPLAAIGLFVYFRIQLAT
ncbi:MAG: CDP-alcohol phosphatidyltransferase family protein [Pseudomonadota bacterium]